MNCKQLKRWQHACKSYRKLAEASKVSVPQSVPKKNQGVGQFVLWTVPFSCYKLGRRANQAEEPHSYKQCPMKRKWLDMVSKQANSPNSKFWSTFLSFGGHTSTKSLDSVRKTAVGSKESMGQFLYSQCSHSPEFADATLQGAQIKQKSLTATSSAVWSKGALTLKISMIWTRYADDYPRSSCGCHQNSFLFGQGNKQGRLRHSSVCIIYFFNRRDSLSELCKGSRLLQIVASSHPARKRNQAEGPHSYKQCLMQLRWLDDS